ncbi:MAG: Athe_2463 domain-containing protein [Bacillota bacterium]
MGAALPAFAGQLFDSQTANDDALNNSGYYLDVDKKGDQLSYVSIPILSNYLKGDSYYGCLVYEAPHVNLKDGQYRYLGYTLRGEDYTNVAFPPDVAHTGYFEDQQWIYWPWRDDDVKANYNIDFNNDLDGSDRYALNIRHGILIYYSDPNNANNYKVYGIDGSTREFWDNIQQYVHILAPPTKYAWGIGRMWRYGAGGQINYMTVPLLPDALLPVNNLVALRMHSGVEGEAEPGVRYTAAVDFQNQSDNPLTGVPVGAFHREWRAVLKDDSGNPVEYTGFAPGEVNNPRL